MAKQGVSVALKIYLPKRLLPGLYAHVEALTKKFKDVEAAKPATTHPPPSRRPRRPRPSPASEFAVKVMNGGQEESREGQGLRSVRSRATSSDLMRI